MEKEIQTKKFHIRSLLAVITGLSQGGRYFPEVMELFDFLNTKVRKANLSEKMNAKKNILLLQFPQLRHVEKDLTQEEVRILKSGSDVAKINEILVRWINQQIAKHGEFFYVRNKA